MAARYGETAAPAALADRVACLWWLRPGPVPPGTPGPAPAPGGGPAAGETVLPGPAAGETVLPDACVDVVWHAGRLTVAGTDTGPVRVPPSPGGALGVRLLPGAASTLGDSGAALRDLRVPVAALWGAEGARLEEQVADAADDAERLRLLLGAVARRADTAPPIDQAVAAARAVLAAGIGGVAAAAAAAGLSERQLHRRVVEHVGYGPKTLGRVLRLQRFLGLAIATRDGLAELAAAAGYADQSHLARECRALADATPGALVAERRPAVSETSKTGARTAAMMAP